MKVLFIISNYPHKNNPVSGNFYKIICEQLACKGIEVYVICPVPYIPFWLGLIFKRLDIYRSYPEFEDKNAVKIYRPRYFRLTFGNFKTRYAHANMRVLTRAKKIKPDIIDVRNYYPAFPFGWFALNINKALGTPFIYTNNGVGIHLSENENKFRVAFYKELLKKASKIFAVSTEIIKEIKDVYKVDASIIRHGIEISKYSSVVTQKRDPNSKVFKIIYVGEMSYLKGVDTLISAIRLLNDHEIHYTFVGANNMGNDIDAVKNKENITYLGRLKHQEALNEIAQSDLLILPTKFEGMPNVLKEAGILNVPVISTYVGGITELLNNGERGELFEAGNETELAQKIEKVKNNYSEAKHKSNLLNAYIIKEYDIERNTLDLINSYKKVLNIQ